MQIFPTIAPLNQLSFQSCSVRKWQRDQSCFRSLLISHENKWEPSLQKKKKKNLQSTNSGKSYLQIKQCSDLSHVWRFLQLATNSVLLECCSARTSANLLTGLRLQRVSTLSRYSSPRAICSRSPTHTQKASSSRSAFAHSPHLSLEVCSPESANRPVMFGSHRVLIF